MVKLCRVVLFSLILCAVVLPAMVLCFGCNQATTAGPVIQPSRQVQQPTQDQNQQTPSNVYVYLWNGASNSPPVPGETASVVDLSRLVNTNSPTSRPASLEDVKTDGAGNGVQSADAGYNIAGTTINITTGGTSGTQAQGDTSGQSTAPGSTISQSPVQRPEASVPVSVAVPIGAMPIAQPTANASVEGPATQTANPTATPTLSLPAGTSAEIATGVKALTGATGLTKEQTSNGWGLLGQYLTAGDATSKDTAAKEFLSWIAGNCASGSCSK